MSALLELAVRLEHLLERIAKALEVIAEERRP